MSRRVRHLLPALVVTLAWTSIARAETSVPADTGCLSADAAVPLTLPANVPGIPIFGPSTEITAALIAADGTEIDTELIADPHQPAWSLLKVKRELVPDTKYTLRWSDDCVGMRTRSFTATLPRPMPTEIGSLIVFPQEGNTSGGMCEGGRPIVDAWRGVRLSPSESLTPFLEVSKMQLVSEAGRSPVVPGSDDVIFATLRHRCPAANTTYTVHAIVYLPDGTTLRSKDVEATFVCPDGPPQICDQPGTGTPTEQPAANGEPDRAPAYGGCTSSPAQSSGLSIVLIGLALAAGTRRR